MPLTNAMVRMQIHAVVASAVAVVMAFTTVLLLVIWSIRIEKTPGDVYRELKSHETIMCDRLNKIDAKIEKLSTRVEGTEDVLERTVDNIYAQQER